MSPAGEGGSRDRDRTRAEAAGSACQIRNLAITFEPSSSARSDTGRPRTAARKARSPRPDSPGRTSRAARATPRRASSSSVGLRRATLGSTMPSRRPVSQLLFQTLSGRHHVLECGPITTVRELKLMVEDLEVRRTKSTDNARPWRPPCARRAAPPAPLVRPRCATPRLVLSGRAPCS